MAYLRVSIQDVSFQSCQVVENCLKKDDIDDEEDFGDDRGRLTKICLETERHLKNGQQDAKMAITMTREDKDTDKDK